VTAWQAERRRAQSSKFQSENARALANLIGAVGDAGDYVEGIDEKKRKREQEDASLGMLRAKTGAAKTDAESSLLKAKASEAAAQEKLLRTKSDSEEKSARITREAAAAEEKARPQKIADAATDVESEISMPGGVSQAQLEQIAVERGLSAKDWRTVLNERDANVDKTNREAAEMANLSAQTAQREAAAKKAARPPKGPSPEAVEERDLRLKKLRAEVDKLTNGATSGKPMSPSDIADLTNERVTIDSLAAIREMAKDPEIMTGSIRGRIENKLASVADSAKWTKFTTAVQIANKLIARAVEGGRMTDADGKFYQEILANPERGPGQFNGILDLMEQLSSDTLTAKLTALGESGYLVPESVKSKPAPAAASAPAASAKVRVSNGQEILEIDKADLGDALADGYKVVR
jgi:hypothetical protein